MSKVVINFKTDAETKKALQKYAREQGVSTDSVLNKQLRQLLDGKEADTEEELVPNEELVKIMEETEEDIKHGYRNITRTNSKEEAIAHLKSLM